MAAPSQEVELLKGGIDSRTPANSSFVLNMLYRRGAWEVRDGFGQVSQHTSSFTLPYTTSGTTDWGIREHMGSVLINTNFGHTQILSIFRARVNTANTSGIPATFNYREQVMVVQIDDVTDGTHWEEALYQHTSINEKTRGASQAAEDSSCVPMAYWHGNYESAADKDRQSWVKAETEKPLFFHEFRDSVFFGSEEIGTWVYYPSHFRHARVNRRVQADTHLPIEAIGKYSESSRVSKVSFTPGVALGYPYFTSSTLPGFSDAATVGGTMVYAGGRQLFFSDPELPASIIADNYVFVPCEGEITAIEEQGGNVLIFTASETFLYRTPASAIRSGGQFTQLSNSIGCVGPQAVQRVDNNVFWISPNGIYATSGNLVLEEVGAGVERFFTDYMTNPLTSFYPQSGLTDAANIQPQTTLQADLKGAHISYCSRYKAVVATFPGNNASLVFAEGKWAAWTYESVAFTSGAGQPEAGVTRNITNPWIVSDHERMFMIGSPDTQLIEGTTTHSYFLTEYGRGGAIDRSVADEDERQPTGFYEINAVVAAASTANTFLVYGEPFRLDAGYKFRGAQPVLTETQQVWVVPVYAVLPDTLAATGISVWQSHFTFNNTAFNPIVTAPGGIDVDFMLPNERVAGESGYTYGAGVVGSRVRLNAVGGNTVLIEFDGTPAPVPTINQTPNRVTPLMYIPLEKLSNTASAASMNIVPVAGSQQFFDGALTVNPMVLAWKRHFLGTDDQRFENSVAQPVDWAYKSGQFGQSESSMFLARGLYSLVLSRGPGLASDYAVTNWDAGLFNTIVSADRKGWMSQIIDYAGANADAIERITDKTSIRTRVKTVTGSLVTEVFGANLFYGTSATPPAGNYLIDDEEVSEIATSDSVRGGTFSYMVFGHIQIKSQKIKLQSVKAAYRLAGSRRRTGH